MDYPPITLLNGHWIRYLNNTEGFGFCTEWIVKNAGIYVHLQKNISVFLSEICCEYSHMCGHYSANHYKHFETKARMLVLPQGQRLLMIIHKCREKLCTSLGKISWNLVGVAYLIVIFVGITQGTHCSNLNILSKRLSFFTYCESSLRKLCKVSITSKLLCSFWGQCHWCRLFNFS